MDLSWTLSIVEKNMWFDLDLQYKKVDGGWNCKRIVDFSGYKTDGRKLFTYHSVNEWQKQNTNRININLR